MATGRINQVTCSKSWIEFFRDFDKPISVKQSTGRSYRIPRTLGLVSQVVGKFFSSKHTFVALLTTILFRSFFFAWVKSPSDNRLAFPLRHILESVRHCVKRDRTFNARRTKPIIFHAPQSLFRYQGPSTVDGSLTSCCWKDEN